MIKVRPLQLFAVIIIAAVIVGVTAYALFLSYLNRGSQNNSKSNGELIYTTRVDANNNAITFTSGPPWLSMMGGSCVNCHGTDGVGGIYPMMCNVKTPDIRYSSLITAGFTDDTIQKAILNGVDESDKGLDSCMPRWRMSSTDLNDLLSYLKHLG